MCATAYEFPLWSSFVEKSRQLVQLVKEIKLPKKGLPARKRSRENRHFV